VYSGCLKTNSFYCKYIICNKNFTHTAGSSSIGIVNTGVYHITFSGSFNEVSQLALMRNGGVIAGSVYGSGAGTQQNNGQVICSLTAGDVLTLRNYQSNAAITPQTLAGGTIANTVLSVVILRLA
jgi:hypothetical protein